MTPILINSHPRGKIHLVTALVYEWQSSHYHYYYQYYYYY